MGFRPRTEITSLFASLMGRLTAFLPQITKPVGPVMATGVLTVARFVGKVGCYLLVRESLGTPQGVPLGTPHGVPPPRSQSRWVPSWRRGCSRWRDLLGKSDVTSWSRVSRDASGRPSRDASRRSTPQITKPTGPVIATGVLTVARFVGKVGSYLLVASLSGRLRASLSGRLTAFHPPDHKAGESRHRDGVAHGGEICPSRELDDPLASQQPCRGLLGGLLGPEALPLVGRAPGCDLSDPSQVMEPRGPTSHTAMAMDPVHGNQSSFGSTDVTLTAQ